MKQKRILQTVCTMAMLVTVVCGISFAGSETKEPSRVLASKQTPEVTWEVNDHFTDDPSALEKAAASVVKLEVYNVKGDKISTGSAFFAFDPLVLVTAAHVIKNMDYAIATCDTGGSFRIESAVDGSMDADVAILRLPEGAEGDALPIAKEVPLRGEKVAAIGSQFSILNLVTLGNVAGRRKERDVDWILFTAPVSAGNSGGPILNDKGEVIGIVSGTYDKGQNLNVAVSILEAENVYYQTYNEGESER